MEMRKTGIPWLKRTGRSLMVLMLSCTMFLGGMSATQYPVSAAEKVTESEELLKNPGFETGTTEEWGAQYSTIEIDNSSPHSGAYALKITDRTQDWSTAVQNITQVLNDCGPGRYKISGWVKLAEPLSNGEVCKPLLVINYNNGETCYAKTERVQINADTYTKLEGEVDISWSGTLQNAQFYVQTGTGGKDCLADIYVDDFSLVNLSREEVNEAGNENLALKKTVTASSTVEGYTPEGIVDGVYLSDDQKDWAADVSEDPQWIEIDFGKNVIFNRVEMYLHDNYTQEEYEVQYLDGGTWKNCFGKVTDNTEVHNTYVFPKVKSSKLRVNVSEGNVLQNGADGGENIARISEVEVYYDQNLALGAFVTASSTQEGYDPSVIVDGRGAASTSGWQHWASDVSTGPQWVEIDFGKEIAFRRAEIYMKSGYEQKSYEIQYWNGAEWVECMPKVENNTEDYRVHNFDEVTGSKLRIYVTEGNTQQNGQGGGENVARISQVEVYATSGIYLDNTVYPEAIPQSIENRSENTVVGAIRWDVWGSTDDPLDEGSQTERVLSPEKYHFRLPWYAQVTGEDSVYIPEYTQEIVDQEILYAKEAGIDYWAFVMYRDRSEEGRQALDLARNLYLSSQYKNEVKWCALLGASDFPVSEYPWLVEQFMEENYQKVQNGRPLVYVYSTSASIVSELRKLCSEKEIPQPYIVVMGTNAKTMKLMQGDALSAYTSYGANGAPYSSVMETDKNNWELWKDYGAQVVPIVSTGWDPRPRIDDPVTWGSYGSEQWAETATPGEIAENLQAALEWNENNKDASFANAVIMYAWNELDEGGWIMPTLGGDGTPNTERLDAIQKVLRSEVEPGNPTEGVTNEDGSITYADGQVPMSDENILYLGRWEKQENGDAYGYFESGIELNFTGTTISVMLEDTCRILYSVDGEEFRRNTEASGLVELASGLSEGTHSLKFYSDYQQSFPKLKYFIIDEGCNTMPQEKEKPIMEFIGDSISVGYIGAGLTNSAASSFAFKVPEKLGFSHNTVAFGGLAVVEGFGAPDTSGIINRYFKLSEYDPEGENPTKWDTAQYIPDYIVINLGTNDFLTADNIKSFKSTYIDFLRRLRKCYPDAVIFAMSPFNGAHKDEISEAVRIMTQAKDTKIQFVDTTGWVDIETETTDKTHPTIEAHDKITDKLVRVVQDYITAQAADELKEVIEEALSVDSSKYTEDSYLVLKQAVDAADTLLQDENASQEELKTAAQVIRQALINLVEETPEEPEEPSAVRELLQKTYDKVKELSNEGVVDSAVKIFEEALANAKDILENRPDATDEEMLEAWNQLVDATNGLGFLKGDKSILEVLVSQAEEMTENEDRYVAEKWPQLEEALAEAKTVLTDNDAMDDTIDQAEDKLLDAILDQRYKANKDNLKALIDKANAIDLSLYTEKSVSVFKAALKTANVVLADESLSQDDQAVVDSAVKELDDAINGLVEISDGGNGNGGDGNTGDNGDNGNGGSGNTGDNENNGNNGSEDSSGDDTEAKDDSKTDAPKTGDNADVFIWGAVMVAALAGILAVLATRRRRKR